MAQQINVNIRMDKEVKEEADLLFNDLGFNLTTAVNAFVKQALRENAIPFYIQAKQRTHKTTKQRLEEFYENNIDTILAETEHNKEKPTEVDWGKPVGEEIW